MDTNLIFDRAMMNGMVHELKAHGLKAYKDAYIMKNTFGYWFHAPSLDFSCDIKADNAYQARYEGWLQYLDKKGLLSDFGSIEDSSSVDK
jgi:hypothetical protein